MCYFLFTAILSLNPERIDEFSQDIPFETVLASIGGGTPLIHRFEVLRLLGFYLSSKEVASSIKELPDFFVILAKSLDCSIEAEEQNQEELWISCINVFLKLKLAFLLNRCYSVF